MKRLLKASFDTALLSITSFSMAIAQAIASIYQFITLNIIYKLNRREK